MSASSNGEGAAASAAPAVVIPENATLAQIDRLEQQAYDAIENVQDPEAAEVLLRQVKIADEAIRIAKVSAERVRRWGRVRLLAERRYGELLPPLHQGKETSDKLSEADRKQAGRARKVAAVPKAELDDYLAREPKPSREGLLREARKQEPKPKKKPQRQASPAKSRSLSYDLDVLNWVWGLILKGWTRDQIVDASDTNEHGWPYEDRALSAGTEHECRAVIFHLERLGVTWPLKADACFEMCGSKYGRKRLREIEEQRAAARRADGREYWAYGFTRDALRYSSAILSTDIWLVAERMDEYSIDALTDFVANGEEVIAHVREFVNSAYARLDDKDLVRKIKALRTKTVENGCTPEEAESSQRKADILESKLQRRIAT